MLPIIGKTHMSQNFFASFLESPENVLATDIHLYSDSDISLEPIVLYVYLKQKMLFVRTIKKPTNQIVNTILLVFTHMVLNNHGKSYRCLAKPITQAIGSRQSEQSKKASLFCKMCASLWFYIRNQVIEGNVSFNLLPSQNVQGHTSMRKHQKIGP
jgi:hypothetical protein